MEYALVALKHIYQKSPGELTTSKEICDENGAPFDATSRVLQRLAQKGFLRSEQGAHGGYILMRDLSKVTFLELTEAVMGTSSIMKCSERPESSCQMAETCNIVSSLSYLNRRLTEFYTRLSVKEVIEARPARKITEDSETLVGHKDVENWHHLLADLEGDHL